MIGDDLAQALVELRAHAASMQHDRVIVRAPSAGSVMDPVTLEEWPEPGAVLYEGPGRVQRGDVQAAAVSPAEFEFVVSRATVQLPFAPGTEKVTDDCVVEVTASRFDDALVGARFVVRNVETKTHATARRLACEQVT